MLIDPDKVLTEYRTTMTEQPFTNYEATIVRQCIMVVNKMIESGDAELPIFLRDVKQDVRNIRTKIREVMHEVDTLMCESEKH